MRPLCPCAVTLTLALVACGSGREAQLPGGSGSGDAEVWQGYLEGQTFPSGSDALQMHLQRDGAGRVVGGVLIVGDGPEPAAPTDPNLGYPPEAESAWAGLTQFMPYDGFRYSLRPGQQTDQRLVLHANFKELWQAWCEMQTPFVSANGSAGCLPSQPEGDRAELRPGACTWNGQPYDCIKIVLCTEAWCQCTASGCTLADGDSVTLDMTLADGDLVGTLVAPTTGDGTVRFSRAPR